MFSVCLYSQFIFPNLFKKRIFYKMTKRAIEDETSSSKKQKNNHWSTALLTTMKDPDAIVKTDDLVTVIKDAYPKAEFHYLILPKENISNLKALKKDHLDLLKHMEDIATEVIKFKEHNNRTFNVGYHAEASMFQLHLHVISDDMNSASLKTKKHWNSYTTDFFLKPEDVRESLEKNGKVSLPTSQECKEFMNIPLKCHKCDFIPKHMPDLKKHIILTHLK